MSPPSVRHGRHRRRIETRSAWRRPGSRRVRAGSGVTRWRARPWASARDRSVRARLRVVGRTARARPATVIRRSARETRRVRGSVHHQRARLAVLVLVHHLARVSARIGLDGGGRAAPRPGLGSRLGSRRWPRPGRSRVHERPGLRAAEGPGPPPRRHPGPRAGVGGDEPLALLAHAAELGHRPAVPPACRRSPHRMCSTRPGRGSSRAP